MKPSNTRKRIHVACVWAAITCLMMSCASLAWAHTLPIERSLMMTIHQDRLEVLMIYTEPPGIRTERILAMYDLDRNGRLTGKELAIASPDIAERAFNGVKIEVNGVVPTANQPELSCKREQDKGLSCALYVDLPLPSGSPETVEVRLIKKSGILPLPMQASASEGFVLEAQALETTPVAPNAVVTLHPGQFWRAKVVSESHLAKPAPLK